MVFLGYKDHILKWDLLNTTVSRVARAWCTLPRGPENLEESTFLLAWYHWYKELKINTKISFVQILKTMVALSFAKLILSGGQKILKLKLFYFQSFSLGNICNMLSDNDCKSWCCGALAPVSRYLISDDVCRSWCCGAPASAWSSLSPPRTPVWTSSGCWAAAESATQSCSNHICENTWKLYNI